MKKIVFVSIVICSLLISCSTLNKAQEAKPTEVSKASKTKPNVVANSSQPNFDLSFLSEKGNESHIDSLGNLIVADSILGQKIRSFLKLQPNDQLSMLTFDTITVLNLGNNERTPEKQKISNIDALAFFKNLMILRLQNNLVRNIGPIENLTHLVTLDLSRNQITNISAVKELVNLRELILYGNGVSDISYLGGILGLQKLNMFGNGIFKIDNLENLVEITELNLGRNYIRDISPLRKMHKLKTLWLFENQVENPEIISECGGELVSLSLAKCGISSIRFLESCTHLRELVIFDNQIEDISSMKRMDELNTFLAANNRISNIDVLAVLVNNGAFRGKGKFTENINIDLANNRIDHQALINQKIEKYLIEKVFKVKL